MRRLLVFGAIVLAIVVVVIQPKLPQLFTPPIQYREGNPQLNSQGASRWRQYQDKDIQWLSNNDQPLEWIESIAADKVGRVWFPSDGNGLFMFDGSRWHQWWLRDYESIGIRGLVIIDSHAYGIFSGSSRGVVAHFDLENMRWDIPWQKDVLKEGATSHQIALDSHNRIYVGMVWQKLGIYDHDQWQVYDVDTKCVGEFPYPFRIDAVDQLWVAIGRGAVCRFTDGHWIKYQIGSAQDNVRNLSPDSAGRLWIPLGNSLIVRTKDNRWYRIGAEQMPLDGEEIEQLMVDSYDRPWVLTNDKLGVYNGKSWKTFSHDEMGLNKYRPTIFPNGMTIDKSGHAWFANGDGAVQLTQDVALEPLASDNSEFLRLAELLSVVEQ